MFSSGHQEQGTFKSGLHVLISAILHFLVLCPRPARADEESMMADLQVLALVLPGSYSNSQQYLIHAQIGMPPHKRHFLLRSEIYKMASPMFNDSLTFYFQDFTKNTKEPFRSGFYSFSMENKMNVLRMRTLKLNSVDFPAGVFGKPPNFTLSSHLAHQILIERQVNFTDLRTYSACDMYWKRLSETTFVGVTGPLCLGSLGNDQVRIGVSMTLTTDRLVMTEGWYRVKDGTRITEVKVPYILQKLETAQTTPLPTISEETKWYNEVTKPVMRGKMSRSNDRARKPEGGIFQSDNNVDDDDDYDFDFLDVERSSRKIRRKADERKKGRKMKHRVLRNFRQVVTALTSGYEVNFRVELSACSAPDQTRVRRLSFGGKVKDFVYIRQAGSKSERKDYVFFLTRKAIIGNQGHETITRHITLLREGRVRVEVIKTFADPGLSRQTFAFDCRLYNEDKGYGGVKLTVNPSIHIRKVDRFLSLMSSIDKGRDILFVADLSRCQGSKKKPAITVGTRLTDYDFVNNGKAMEVFLPLVSEQDDRFTTSTQPEGFVGQILKSGDVMLTWISSQSKLGVGNAYHISTAYHCKLSNHNAVDTNESIENSVSIFYTK